MRAKAASVDEYLAGLPPEHRAALERLRKVIRTAAPEAEESISYTIPTFKHRGKPLIYFGAAKSHLAIYGTPAGTVRFTPAAPLDAAYVTKLVADGVAAIDAKLVTKRKARA